MLLLKNFCICLRSITIGIGSLSYLLIFLFKQFKLTICIIHRTVSIQEQLLRKDFQSKTDIKRSLTVRCRTSQFIFPIIRITILITPSSSRTSILIPRIRWETYSWYDRTTHTLPVSPFQGLFKS